MKQRSFSFAHIVLNSTTLVVLAVTYPFSLLWRIKTKRQARDTSWHYGRELIFSQGIHYWKDQLANFRIQIADKDVLEVGSGNGQWLIAVADLRARSVCGVEPNDLVRNYCTERLREYDMHRRVKVEKASAESLPFPDASFDVLLCMGVFMFTDQATALKEFYRVLRPGGQLLLTVNGLGYFLMKAKDGILFSQRREIKYGITGIISTAIKWISGIQIGSAAVNVAEISKRLADNGYRLEKVWLHVNLNIYPLEHFCFPTNYALRAIKSVT